MDFRVVAFAPSYEVSACGVVRNARTKHVLGHSRTTTSPYMYVPVRIDGKPKKRSVHRMVATAWLPNPDDMPQVNHKDGNKENNNVWNLEWCTSQHNTQHSRDTGLNTHKPMHNTGKFGSDHNRSAIIVAYPSRQVFFGLSEASRCLCTGISRIGYLLKTGATGHDGVSFKYIAPMIRT